MISANCCEDGHVSEFKWHCWENCIQENSTTGQLRLFSTLAANTFKDIKNSTLPNAAPWSFPFGISTFLFTWFTANFFTYPFPSSLLPSLRTKWWNCLHSAAVLIVWEFADHIVLLKKKKKHRHANVCKSFSCLTRFWLKTICWSHLKSSALKADRTNRDRLS